MASERFVFSEGSFSENTGDKLPKNRDSDTYATSKRGDPVGMHSL